MIPILALQSCASIKVSRANRPATLVPLADGHLEITGLGNRAFRVRATRPPAIPRSTYMDILLPAVERTRPEEHIADGKLRLSLPHISCEVDMRSGRLQFFDGDGKMILSEAKDGRSLAESTLQGRRCLIATQAFDSPADERIFGMGCFQDGRVNLRGWPRRLTQVNTQISLPFILSSKGYGLLWHNTGMSEFNPQPHMVALERVSAGATEERVNATTTSGNAEVIRRGAIFEARFTVERPGRHAFLVDSGSKMASRIHVEIDGVEQLDLESVWLPPTASFTVDLAPGEHVVRITAREHDAPVLQFGPVLDRSTWRSPVADAVDYVVIAGPGGDDIMQAYHALTGRTPILPRWAYGYTHCRERFHSSEEILENAREFRERKLPIDIIVQDWQYWGRHGWNAMRFDERFYPDPAALVDRLHALNMRLMLSVWAKVPSDTALGKEFASRGYLINGTDWVDFYNPAAAAFYAAKQNTMLTPLGVDAWWQDATEPENDDLVGRQTFAGGGEWVRNNYSLQVARTVYEAQRSARPDRRALILTRSAFSGQQRYAAETWSGDIGNDWGTLARQVAAGIGMAAGGYPYWTVDAGGFFRPGDSQYTDLDYHERFLRWFQFATFLPSQRVHGYQTNTEFWRYGQRVEAISRDYLNLRYRLLPYIYTMGADAWRNAAPLIRPLVFDFADDPAALDQSHSYMFGRHLLVSPVLEPGVRSWPCYLPAGAGWWDFWTGEFRPGGGIHQVAADISRIPLHVRAGSILPLGPVVQSTVEATGEGLELHVYPGADGTYELYEDAGTDYGYEKGAFSLIRMRWHDASRTLEILDRQGTFPGILQDRAFTAVLHGIDAKPKTFRYAGSAIRVKLA